MRPGIEVRRAEPGDVDGLVQLCLSARSESALGSQVCSPDARAVAQQVGALAASPGGTVLVAVAEGVTVGLLLGRIVGPNVFTDETSLSVDAVYVAPSHRRRGTGHALMLGATDIASAAGAAHVYVYPVPGARVMQRFFARLGFAPAATHRVAATAALQRRLTHEASSGRRAGSRGIEDLIARRRRSRRPGDADPVVA